MLAERDAVYDNVLHDRRPAVAHGWLYSLYTTIEEHDRPGWRGVGCAEGTEMLAKTTEKRRFSRFRRVVLRLAFIGAVLLATRSSVIRPYRVDGPSAAPTVLVGDLVWVNLVAYGLRTPFTNLRILNRGAPQRGDLAFCHLPGRDGIYIKRVIGVDGDVIELHGNELTINGKCLSYEPLDPALFSDVPTINTLGDRFAIERVDDASYVIAYEAAGSRVSDFGPVQVPPDHCFVLGDNRDNSYDSRAGSCGFLPRSALLGRLIGAGRSIPVRLDVTAAE